MVAIKNIGKDSFMDENKEINQRIKEAKKEEKMVQNFRNKMIENAKLPDPDDKRRRILVVDDDIVALRMFSNILSDEYNVSVVKSGADAITFLAKEKVDLILLDYEMPVMDGPTTLQAIRSQEEIKDIPVLFLTAVKDAEMVTRALALRPNGYILKSTPPEELKLRVTTELS